LADPGLAHRPISIHPGDRITADFGPLGSVAIEIAD